MFFIVGVKINEVILINVEHVAVLGVIAPRHNGRKRLTESTDTVGTTEKPLGLAVRGRAL